jgi:hypothetical protein
MTYLPLHTQSSTLALGPYHYPNRKHHHNHDNDSEFLGQCVFLLILFRFKFINYDLTATTTIQVGSLRLLTNQWSQHPSRHYTNFKLNYGRIVTNTTLCRQTSSNEDETMPMRLDESRMTDSSTIWVSVFSNVSIFFTPLR